MKTYQFPCGCSFPVIGEPPVSGGFPLLDFFIEDVPRDCPAVYETMSRGDTVGVFQLEKPLGQDWSRKLKPENMEHIAALGALLRPGTLNSKDEKGVSMTEHYCRRKNKTEEVDYINPNLEPHLSGTYGIVAYQEIFMSIARDIAGYTLVEVDKLRKSIGKKDYKIISELKNSFIDGCNKVGKIDSEQAHLIWSFIEAAGRYSFNKSHAVEYAYISYETMYAKVHNPAYFYTAWLNGASLSNGKIRDVFAIFVEDANKFNIKINPPSILNKASLFFTDSASVTYGIANIKGIGEKSHAIYQTVAEYAQQLTGKSLHEFSWFDYYVLCLTRVSRTIATNLIASGACDCFTMSRARMLAEHELYCQLKQADQEWLYQQVELRYSGSDGKQEQERLDELLAERGRLKAENKAIKGYKAPTYLENEIKELRFRLTCIESRTSFNTMEEGLAALATVSKESDVILGHLAILKNPPVPLTDSVRSIVAAEEELLGVALTAHRCDQADLTEANCSVSEFLAGRTGRLFLGLEVVMVKRTVTKAGKNPGANMCQLVLRDRTGKLSGVCFPEDYKNCGHLLSEGAVLFVQGERSKKEASQLIVKNVWLPNN